MPITYGNVGGAEPSTITFRVGTVVIPRGSTNEQQEILVIGDPQSSIAIARVVAAPPASTEYGLIVRVASGPSSGGDFVVSGNSTVFQGTSPWVVSPNSTTFVKNAGFSVDSSNALNVKLDGSTALTIGSVAAGAGRLNIGSTAADNAVSISGNSTVVQGTSPWVIGFQAANISSNAQSGNSSGLTVRPVWSSSGVDQPVRAVFSSTAADNPVLMQGNSTVFQGTNPWVVSPNSTAFVKNAGFSVDSSNALNVKLDGSTALTIGSVAAGAGRLNIGSTAADNAVLVSGNSTVFQGGAPWSFNIGTNLQSTAAPSSASSGLIVRQVVDVLTAFASTSALASTVLSCVSSVANVRTYVTAYTITSTNQTPAQWGFFSSNATLLWPMTVAALSSGVAGVNLAVAPPGYLFRTAVGEALNFKTNGSTVASVQLGVAYYAAP